MPAGPVHFADLAVRQVDSSGHARDLGWQFHRHEGCDAAALRIGVIVVAHQPVGIGFFQHVLKSMMKATRTADVGGQVEHLYTLILKLLEPLRRAVGAGIVHNDKTIQRLRQ